jgi:hypothetical protein
MPLINDVVETRLARLRQKRTNADKKTVDLDELSERYVTIGMVLGLAGDVILVAALIAQSPQLGFLAAGIFVFVGAAFVRAGYLATRRQVH